MIVHRNTTAHSTAQHSSPLCSASSSLLFLSSYLLSLGTSHLLWRITWNCSWNRSGSAICLCWWAWLKVYKLHRGRRQFVLSETINSDMWVFSHCCSRVYLVFLALIGFDLFNGTLSFSTLKRSNAGCHFDIGYGPLNRKVRSAHSY